MKKILGSFSVIFFIFINISKAESPWGEGELQLSDNAASWFIQFVKGKGRKSPADFYVTIDGSNASYWYCSEGRCRPGVASEDIKVCEKQTGKKCKKFAFRRTVKWKNGINPAKGKASTFNSKWSEQEILAKLTELGFYKNNLVSKKKKEKKIEKKKETKKTTSSASNNDDLTENLKTLNELYKSGVLTKEEFTKAKEKLLN
jgi:hypothetical protein